MNEDTCPHCNAALQYPHSRYECGVLVNRSDARTARCYERREATLEAELEERRIELEATGNELSHTKAELEKFTQRSCGCIVCVCVDEQQCQGCGAHECEYHGQQRRRLEAELEQVQAENGRLLKDNLRFAANQALGVSEMQSLKAERDKLMEIVADLAQTEDTP
jgi:hypothetical protein